MKRQAIAALTSGLALLLAAAVWVSAQEPTVPWSVITGGGGSGSGGNVTLHDTVGEAIIGYSAGAGMALDAGHWQQIYGPASIADLRGSVEAGTVNLLRLDWTAVSHDVVGHSIASAAYNVYREHDAPYFTPGGAAYNPAPLIDPTYPDPDTTVLTSAGGSTYYVVKAVHSNLSSESSNRVGAFVFALTGGQ